MCNSGLSPSLHLESHLGKAIVTLKVVVGIPPPPLVLPQRYRGQAYERRQLCCASAKDAEKHKDNADNMNVNATEKVGNTKPERV